jgi:hypothetical protein
MTPDQNNGDKPIINVEEEIQSAKEKARSTAKQHLLVEDTNRGAAELEEDIDSKYRVLGRIRQYQEVLAGEPESVEELITALQKATFEDLKKSERDKKYGKGTIGKIKAWLAGEYDVKVSGNEVKGGSNWAAGTRKITQTLLNKKNVAAAATSVGIGILTGGAGFAATGVIAGSSVGRLTAEALTYGKEMKARKEVLLAEKERWYQLTQLALEYDEAQETEKKTNIANQIVDIYHQQGESAVIKQLGDRRKTLAETRESQDKLRHRLQIAGGIIGGGAGVASEVLSGKISGAIDLDLWNKVDRQNLAHQITKVNGEWHFLYTEAEKAAGLAGDQASHILGNPIWLGSNQADIALATTIQRTVPVLATAWAGSILADKVGEAGARNKELKRINKNQEIADRLKEESFTQTPEANQRVSRSKSSPEEEEDDIKNLFEQSKNPFPEVGQIWFKELSKEEKERRGKDGLNVGLFKIESIDEENNQVEISNIDPESLIMEGEEEVIDKVTIKLSDLAADTLYNSKGRELAQGTQEQLKQQKENDKVESELNIDTNQPVVVPLNEEKANDIGIDMSRFGDRKPGLPIKVREIDENYALIDILNPFSLFIGKQDVVKENIRMPLETLSNGQTIDSYWPDLEE